jgi:alkylation response protein AidB-like acyl-CoA dehydrogenase
MPIPEQYGGSGGSLIDCCLVNGALGQGGRDGGFGLSLGAHWVIGSVPIWLHGTEEQRQRYLPGLTSGLRDFPAERALRDAKLASIGGGTTEIQKMIISRTLLG